MKQGRRRLALALGLLALPLWVAAQTVNLVEMKKQEEERRRHLDKSKLVVTDSNINELQAAASGKGYGIVQVEPGDVSAAEAPPAAAAGEGAAPAPAAESDPEKTPGFWKEQKEALDQRIATLEQAIADDQAGLNELRFRQIQTGLLNEQLELNRQIQELLKQLGADQVALADARAELDALLDRARRQRIPRTWVD